MRTRTSGSSQAFLLAADMRARTSGSDKAFLLAADMRARTSGSSQAFFLAADMRARCAFDSDPGLGPRFPISAATDARAAVHKEFDADERLPAIFEILFQGVIVRGDITAHCLGKVIDPDM
jgi:hypothetical protein